MRRSPGDGRFFDQVARALAEPMPRRRALRVVGASVAALAVPGLRAPAAAARPSAAPIRCRPDQRVCGEFTDNQWCCPRPSWQFFCGRRPGQCDNTCSGTKFACTALYAHPESGINGVCCDRRYHKKCNPTGRAATCCYGSPITCKPMSEAQCRAKPGGQWAPSERWKPSCEPCLTPCGPNPAVEPKDPLRWVCCTAPHVCRKGVCTCPGGGPVCPDPVTGKSKCCPRGKVCRASVYTDGELVADFPAQCCGKEFDKACANRCCRPDESCCGPVCCPKSLRCARTISIGEPHCCPNNQYLGRGPDGIRRCCPPGTVKTTGVNARGCCPPGDPDCCLDANGNALTCPSGAFCLRGRCVAPEW